MANRSHFTGRSENVSHLVTQAVTLLGQSCLAYDKHLRVEGLLVFTLDDKEVLVVNINDTLQAKKEDDDSNVQQAALTTVPDEHDESDHPKCQIHVLQTSCGELEPTQSEQQTVPTNSCSPLIRKGKSHTARTVMPRQGAVSRKRFSPRLGHSSPTKKLKLQNVQEEETDDGQKEYLEQATDHGTSSELENNSDFVLISLETDRSFKIPLLTPDVDDEEVSFEPEQNQDVHDPLGQAFGSELEHSPNIVADENDKTENVYWTGDKWHCSVCNRPFSKRNVARQHVREIHGQYLMFKCYACSYMSKRMGTLKLHIREVHERTKQYKCPHCDFSVAWEKKLKIHVRKAHGAHMVFKCKKCRLMKVTQEDLKEHMREVHPKYCESDDISGVPISDDMVRHMKEETKDVSSQMNNTNNEDSALDPVLVELEQEQETTFNDADLAEKVYKKGMKWYCGVCEHSFSQRYVAKLHFRENHGQHDIYKCHTCGFMTKRKGSLRMHVKEIHERVEPYKCPHCDFSVTWEKNLKKHIRNTHGAHLLYNCKKCRIVKVTQVALKEHMHEVHPKYCENEDNSEELNESVKVETM